jgi:hypothetical protein
MKFIDSNFIAPCGINCGVCKMHLLNKTKCPGCRVIDAKKPKTRVNCKFKNCEIFKNGKATFCYQCEEFPCQNLKHLDQRYRTKYHMSMIENLENIKKNGLAKFLKNEQIRWTCDSCGGTVCEQKGSCIDCEKEKPYENK